MSSAPANPDLNWKSLFKVPAEMDTTGAKFLIKNFLPEGITFIGGLSTHGKTSFGLSLAKALYSGNRFLSHYEVIESLPIIYLIPECGESSFGGRLKTMRLAEVTDGFFVRTMNQQAISLTDDRLLLAVQELHPVVFLDTAIRFSVAKDENDANQNAQGLAQSTFTLMSNGARAVIGLHHSPKLAGKKDKHGNYKVPTLETALRGSGDFGAMADNVICLQCVDKEKLELEVYYVKARDFEEPTPFTIQGRPYLNDTGDFHMMDEHKSTLGSTEEERLGAYLKLFPKATYRQIVEATGVGKNRIPTVARVVGWKKKDGLWVQSVQ